MPKLDPPGGRWTYLEPTVNGRSQPWNPDDTSNPTQTAFLRNQQQQLAESPGQTPPLPQFICKEAASAPAFTPHEIRIVIIGAGASGINMARKLQETLAGLPFTLAIYEKNDGIGGTWHENRYPGIRCDLPSLNYQFSWRPNRGWTNFNASGEEIRQYLVNAAMDEGITVKTGMKVTAAKWDDARGKWTVTAQHTATDELFNDVCNFVIDASGFLNNWIWPDVPGRDIFKGQLVHTANWPDQVDYKDRTVAIIGNGASGVQLLPQVVQHAGKVYHIIRKPTWIVPSALEVMQDAAPTIISQLDMDSEGNLSAQQIEVFKQNPALCDTLAEIFEEKSNLKYHVVMGGNGVAQRTAQEQCWEFMAAKLGNDADLCAALIPTYPVGCRRATPAPGYLEALTNPKVRLVTHRMTEFVEKGIKLDNGQSLEVDVIMCATGFNTSLIPSYKLQGSNDLDLNREWAHEIPRAYMSLAVEKVPNYFKFFGPNAPVAHGDVLKLSEHIAAYVAGLVRTCQVEGVESVVPSARAVADYNQHLQVLMEGTVFGDGGCRSWYRGGPGAAVTGIYPGTRAHFIQMLGARFRAEDWDFAYLGEGGAGGGAEGGRPYRAMNRFGYLGNGFTEDEVDTLKGGGKLP